MVLHKVQEELGYIPRAAAFRVANDLDIPVAKVYGVVTFYHFFKLEKPGRHSISVCMGLCYSEPTVEVIMPDMPTVIYGNVEPADAERIIDQDIDVSLTTRELVRMIKSAGIRFNELQDEECDNILGEYSGAGTIFGATGGVMEAALRTMCSPRRIWKMSTSRRCAV